MSISKEQHLWEACTSGDLELVKHLASDPAVNVNWGDPEFNRTAFYRACFHGHLSIVEFLLNHPQVEVNKSQQEGGTPFYAACQEGHLDVAKLLLTDTRIDVNKLNQYQSTPLLKAAEKGHMPIVQLLFASGREVDTKIKTIAGPARWNNKTAAEIARLQGPLIAALIDSFEADPAATRQQLRELPELRDSFMSDLFALVVFLCDGLLLTVDAESSASFFVFFTKPSTSQAVRFFRIAQSLPMELQMVLCNRVFGSGKDHVLTKHSEPAFKKLGRFLAKDSQ